MPLDALPDNLNPEINPDAWEGTDDDTWYARWKINLLGLQAYGPRSKYWWAKWREIPEIIFAMGGKGVWRWENTDGSIERFTPEVKTIYDDPSGSGFILSRVQYWKRWHFAVQWPLQITFHVYWRKSDMPVYPSRPVDLSLGKMLYTYGPIHRDADKVYWLFSFYFGGTWK